MAIQVNVENEDAVKEFITEQEGGGFTLDGEGMTKVIHANRAEIKSLKAELAPLKALGMSADQIKAFVELGKTPAELAEMIAKAATPAPKPNVKQSTEYLELKKELDALAGFRDKWEAAEKKNLENKRNDLVRAAVRALPDEYDKELFMGLVESALLDKFSLNDAHDALTPIGEQLPGDYLKDIADRYHFKKQSTPGIAAPGNTTINAGGNASYLAAKEKGDVSAMLDAAPEKKNF